MQRAHRDDAIGTDDPSSRHVVDELCVGITTTPPGHFETIEKIRQFHGG